MTILVIAPFYPMFDRAAGDLRFFELLKILSAKYAVIFCPSELRRQRDLVGADEVRRYQEHVIALGVKTSDQELIRVVKSYPADIALFEFYHTARMYLDLLRLWQPKARAIIDSVDVHFRRFFSKAQLSGEVEDFNLAATVKQEELAAYRSADLVLTVTDEDREALKAEDDKLQVGMIPTIHSVPAHRTRKRCDLESPVLIFVGGFAHEPNVDAVQYFCADIWPRIRAEIPNAKLKIIGSNPPDSVKNFACSHVDVTGYVPDIGPHLEQASISIAPLRFGAGMKGKIGEALSYGLPVVSTSIGVEGFGLSNGENVLIGDSPDEFSRAVIRLVEDKQLHETLSVNGRKVIDDKFSQTATAANIYSIFEGVLARPVKKLPTHIFLKKRASDFLDRHLLWRFK